MTNQYEQLSKQVAKKFGIDYFGATVIKGKEDDYSDAEIDYIRLYQDWNMLIPLALEHGVSIELDLKDRVITKHEDIVGCCGEYFKDHETKELALAFALMEALLEVG